jgi:hypothetical protein
VKRRIAKILVEKFGQINLKFSKELNQVEQDSSLLKITQKEAGMLKEDFDKWKERLKEAERGNTFDSGKAVSDLSDVGKRNIKVPETYFDEYKLKLIKDVEERKK